VKRHEFDPISFVFGLLFAFLAAFVLTGNTLADLWPTWALTLPAMTVGLLVVLYAVRRLTPSRGVEEATASADDEPADG
jgi:hypothetical protein